MSSKTPTRSEDDRGAILQMAQQPLPAEPSGPERVVSQRWRDAQGDAPGVVMAALALLGRAEGQDPNAPPAHEPQTPQEWEATHVAHAAGITGRRQCHPWPDGRASLGQSRIQGRGNDLVEADARSRQSPSGPNGANALPAIGEAGGNYLSRQANVAMGS